MAASLLRYLSDEDTPGISRAKRGTGFAYFDARGRKISDARTLERIRSIVIPPAWTEVWISPAPHGHIQATGRDARGRKQYRYHPLWRARRDRSKYAQLESFARALPAIRRGVARDLRKPGLPREKVLAAIVRLLESSMIRVGNDEYTKSNGSYGLTTLRDHHVRFRGAKMRFAFRGKSGVKRDVELEDRRLARIVKQRAGRQRAAEQRAGGEKRDRRGDQDDGGALGKYDHRVPKILCPPRCPRSVSGG